MTPAAAEIEAVLSLRVDYNENWRVRAAAAIACETQETKRWLIIFWIGQTVYFSLFPHRLLCAAA